ncbi:MAG: hypothetical protein C0606_08785 [Hyphomicrobiales bacterium]|nr:MAG: hypothetical protein C0606_08785 [Hyphomicrobiales bacterium]
MSELPKSAQKVADAAGAAGLAVTVLEMPDSTRTADEAAAACQCTVGQIVKSLIFRGRDTDTPYLFLVSGANRVDEKGVAAHLGEKLKRPDANDVRALTGYAIGGIPPIGHDAPLATYMDEDLIAFDVVWAAAGTPRCVFSVDPKALEQATGAHVLGVKKPA